MRAPRGQHDGEAVGRAHPAHLGGQHRVAAVQVDHEHAQVDARRCEARRVRARSAAGARPSRSSAWSGRRARAARRWSGTPNWLPPACVEAGAATPPGWSATAAAAPALSSNAALVRAASDGPANRGHAVCLGASAGPPAGLGRRLQERPPRAQLGGEFLAQRPVGHREALVDRHLRRPAELVARRGRCPGSCAAARPGAGRPARARSPTPAVSAQAAPDRRARRFRRRWRCCRCRRCRVAVSSALTTSADVDVVARRLAVAVELRRAALVDVRR